MQDLLIKIDLIGVGLLAHSASLAGGAGCGAAGAGGALFGAVGRCAVDGGGDADLLGFEGGFVGLEDDFGFDFGVGGVDHEVIVVAAGHDVAAVAAEDDFEFVEDTIILVCVAEAGSEVFVDGDGLDGLSFHVDIPYLDGQVISGENVPTIVGEADIGNGGDDF